MKIIVLLGRPGSGKGTQAKLLMEKFNLKWLGTGDLLRAEKKKKSFTGKNIGKIIDVGKRILTPVVFKLWMNKFEEFKKTPKLNGFILDGSPRSLFEAEMLEQAFEWYEWLEGKKIIYIDISPKEAIKRLTSRRMCKKCGKSTIFPLKNIELGKCDNCNGQLVSRNDDTVEGVKKRLAWFKTDVGPVINYYKKQGSLIEVNGEQSIENIHRDILKVIK
jgi:adenylate kinase